MAMDALDSEANKLKEENQSSEIENKKINVVFNIDNENYEDYHGED